MRSLYVRVLLVTVYSIAISSFLGYYVATAYYHGSQKPGNDAKLMRTAEQIRDHIEQYPEAMGDYLFSTAQLGYRIYVYDEEGNDIYFGRPFAKNDLSEDAKRRVLRGEAYHGVADYPNKAFETGYFDNALSNTVGVSVSAEAEGYALFLRQDSRFQFDELRMFFLVMFALTVLFSIPYFLLSARYLVQPIIRLTEATKKVAQGQYNFRIPMKRKDEIGQLANHFQKMSLELERSDRTKKEFVANVSHEIQSPLASIQGYADSLIREDADPEQIRYYASIIGQETRHLAALSRQLLLLSTLDHSGYTPGKQSFLLQPQLRQALQLLEWQLAEKEVAVRMLIPGKLMIYGDEVLLMQVWSNLLSNAVKHIPAGRSIHVQAAQEEGTCVVTIADTGHGIPEEQLPYIYDRFYRGDSARDRRSGSTGLGLSIVQKIVHLHGGTIEAESRPGEGTTFAVRIPDETVR
ncbi:HAMP domain-containing sensor histidine kinase [Paenibacillus sp. LHD-117]|uniref:sensor histidine kinase n=1 Tax=Paenibacillus sp. LHD-117 TaxID=3071412 RepID=UPI0027DF772B|nr:HAMP domain-containing sensor histidine kinase [Paenibacillus sp. LHD-117]MDQ6422044.1 HAMP domain-containing sensor histidine kinase [Paenibacillus sp. LHD-117]